MSVRRLQRAIEAGDEVEIDFDSGNDLLTRTKGTDIQGTAVPRVYAETDRSRRTGKIYKQ